MRRTLARHENGVWIKCRTKMIKFCREKNLLVCSKSPNFPKIVENERYRRPSWPSLASQDYLTIIPRTRMGSKSIAHSTKGRMGYWLRGHEGERNNCFSKIQLVGQKISSQNNFSWLTLDFNLFWPRKSRPFSLLVGYNIEPRSSSTNQNAALMIDH